MDITAAQLELYMTSYAEIPYKVLQQLTSVVNYGGRVTDDKDMRTSDILIADFFQADILRGRYFHILNNFFMILYKYKYYFCRRL
jgi:dynein heavy chain